MLGFQLMGTHLTSTPSAHRHTQPSPQVKRAAWQLFAFVRQEIAAGMQMEAFSVARPAQLHDELRHFLDVFDDGGKYRPKKR